MSESNILIEEWDVKKNAELGLEPQKLVLGSNKYAFWKCRLCGNEWRAQIQKRGVRGQGCPQCGKKKANSINSSAYKKKIEQQGSLADNYPQLVNEWDFEKNNITPTDVLSGSNLKVWWKCDVCKHNWETMIAKRTTRGQGCPKCGQNKMRESHERLILERIKKQGSVGSRFPELVCEWDNEKNDRTPYEYLPGSNVEVFWKCSKCGNEWKASINSRTNGVSCIKCGRIKSKETLLRNLIDEKGSLADNCPEIAIEWDYEKNIGLSPSDVMLNTNKSVWWLCKECGHSWKTAVSNRTNGRGCPKCSYIKHSISLSKPIIGINDLMSQAPNLAQELHPTKNDITAEQLARSSTKKVWWLGKCGHEWMATVGSRYSGGGCPICLKEFKVSYPEKAIFYYLKRYLPVEVKENYRPKWLNNKELDIYIPELSFAIEYDGYNWHKDSKLDQEKNVLCKINNINLLRIREEGSANINYNNVYYVNMKSEKDSELEDVIKYVFGYILRNYGVSAEYKIDLTNDRNEIYDLMEMNRKKNSLLYLYPHIAEKWHPTKNGRITPEYVNAHTHRKYWWICPLGHTYDMAVKHKTEKDAQCPICSNHRVLKGYNDLETKRPDVIPKWDFVKNDELQPSEVTVTSNIKVWWKCEKGHSYQRIISHQTTRESECPICSMRMLSKGINDLKTLYNDVALEWDYEMNGDANPEDFTPISKKRFNWKCMKCGKKWVTSISNRCVSGTGCPSCAKRRVWEQRKKKVK